MVGTLVRVGLCFDRGQQLVCGRVPRLRTIRRLGRPLCGPRVRLRECASGPLRLLRWRLASSGQSSASSPRDAPPLKSVMKPGASSVRTAGRTARLLPRATQALRRQMGFERSVVRVVARGAPSLSSAMKLRAPAVRTARRTARLLPRASQALRRRRAFSERSVVRVVARGAPSLSSLMKLRAPAARTAGRTARLLPRASQALRRQRASCGQSSESSPEAPWLV